MVYHMLSLCNIYPVLSTKEKYGYDGEGINSSGGGIAVIESHLVDHIPLLHSPGIPWNLDVSLMALVYIGIGFFYKEQIKKLIEMDSVKYDIAALLIAMALAVFCCINYGVGKRLYYFDMKPVYYKELVSAILIPCAFGLVITRTVHWLTRNRCYNVVNVFFALCGRTTIPIMFMHIPLNHWKASIGYGRCVYTLIGVAGPLLFTAIFCRFSLMRRLFGLPDLREGYQHDEL